MRYKYYTLSLISLFLLLSSFTSAIFSQIKDSSFVDDSANVIDSIQVEDSTFSTNKLVTVKDSVSAKIDSLAGPIGEYPSPIYRYSFSSQGTSISKTDILRDNYRYTGDFLKIFPLNFERSYGFIGQPNDVYLYGESSSRISYFNDDMPIIKSSSGTLDLNQIQNEDIDSIELAALPRGFLYGFNNNPVAVNFITKDMISSEPYSRIKYYEGPSGEAFIDGIFGLHFFRDLYNSVEITNRKVDDSYTNSNFSSWQFNTKFRYNLSANVNLIGSYYFTKSETGINGGIDYTRAQQSTANVNSLIFSETLAPVNFEKNTLNTKLHNFGLTLLIEPSKNFHSDLNFYHKYHLDEYNAFDSLSFSKSSPEQKVLGATLNQYLAYDIARLNLFTGYQSFEYTPNFLTSDTIPLSPVYYNYPLKSQSFFISPLISVFLFDSTIVPSFFFKFSKTHYNDTTSLLNSDENLRGYGADLSIYLNTNFNFYLGYSEFETPYFPEKVKVAEFNVNYINNSDKLSLTAFQKNTAELKYWGLGVNVSYYIWKFLIESRISHYFKSDNTNTKYFNFPETNIFTGIYYKDILFDSHLDLKTGFTASYTGRQELRAFNIPFLGELNTDVDSWFIVDFTVNAKIQDAAIVYFTWENLFDWKYYITPYYPMLQRNIRFGIAWEIFN